MQQVILQMRDDARDMHFYILGIGLVLLCQSSLRFSGMSGIFPLESQLTFRHLLAVAVLVPFALTCVRSGLAENARAQRVLTIALSVLLSLCFLITFWSPARSMAIANVAEIAKEALIVLLLVLWLIPILPAGPHKAITAFGAAATFQGMLQLGTCWLQYEAHLAFISIVPLVACGLYLVAIRAGSAQQSECAPSSNVEPAKPSTYVFAVVAAFCLMLAVGQIIYYALDVQQAMDTSVFAEVNMGIGNILGGIVAMFIARKITDTSFLSYTFLIVLGLIAIAFYFTSFENDFMAALFLVVSSGIVTVLQTLPIALAFFSRTPAFLLKTAIARCAVALSSIYLARSVSSTLMILDKATQSIAYYVAVAVAMTAVLVCSVMLVAAGQAAKQAKDANRLASNAHALDASGAIAPQAQEGRSAYSDEPSEPNSANPPEEAEPPEETPESTLDDARQSRNEAERPRTRPFWQAIDDLSEENMLTAQERFVFARLAQGLNARSIAEDMTLSVNTIRSHMRNAYAKLNVHSQQELIALVNERVESVKAQGRDS